MTMAQTRRRFLTMTALAGSGAVDRFRQLDDRQPALLPRLFFPTGALG